MSAQGHGKPVDWWTLGVLAEMICWNQPWWWKNLRKWWNMRVNHVKPAKWWLLYEYFMVPSGISSNHSNLGTGRSLIFIDDFPSKPRFISGIFQRATFVFCGAVKSWIYPSVDHDISGTKITMNRTKNCVPFVPLIYGISWLIWDIMGNMGQELSWLIWDIMGI